MEQTAYLCLENGEALRAKAFGALHPTVGELVFTTAMTGYLETLTDPSYYGHIVIQTFPLIGNYGIISSDFESPSVRMRAYIVRSWCQEPSNFRSEGSLGTFLQNQGVVGLYDIDTRALTRIVRESGVMNARICLNEPDFSGLKGWCIQNAVPSVTCARERVYPAENPRFRVALWDFGAKESILRLLLSRGCEVIRLPAQTAAERIMALDADGLVLSNGPGDPADNTGIIGEIARLPPIPTMGICLGHQLMALAHGAKTEKLKYGHRGANQPALERATGRVYITSQNHGYAVKSETLPRGLRESFVNANDHTCEGIEYEGKPAFSVQFHPEAAAGPKDTEFLFDRFMKLMQKENA